MRTLLTLAFGLFFSGTAGAVTDTSCINGDCLTYGWEVTNTKNGDLSSIACTNLDCATEGWTSAFKGQEQVEVRCKSPGCFLMGWRAFDVSSGRLLANVSCLRSFSSGSDCLRNGWETHDVNVGRYVTLCRFDDCEYAGWETRVPGYQPQLTRCKEGGCFQEGWVTSP